MDTKIYWASVRKIQTELALRGDTVHVVTLENEELQLKGGAVSVCHPELAAKLIVNGHHALATEAQVEQYESQNLRRAALIGAESRWLARANRKPGEKEGIVYEPGR